MSRVGRRGIPGARASERQGSKENPQRYPKNRKLGPHFAGNGQESESCGNYEVPGI